MEYRMSCTVPPNSGQHRSQLVVNRSQQWSTECHALCFKDWTRAGYSWWLVGASNEVQNAMPAQQEMVTAMTMTEG